MQRNIIKCVLEFVVKMMTLYAMEQSYYTAESRKYWA